MTLILLCFQQAVAQKKMYIGLKGSPGVSWFQPKTTGLDSKGARLSFSYGLLTDFNFTDNYSFGTGLEVNHHSGEVKYTDISGENIGTSTELLKLQYIEVPLTIKMRTNEIGYFTYYGQFGLGASYLIGAKGDASFTGAETEEKSSDVNVYDDVKPFRASLIIGLGAEYNVSGSTKLLIGVTFDNGFTNPLKGRVYEEDENGNITKGEKLKVTSNFISLNLGIIF